MLELKSDKLKVVFVFSDGKKHLLNQKLYNELCGVLSWLGTRAPEFRQDLERLELITMPGKFSILEIHSSGQKKLLENLESGEYIY